MLAKLQHPVCVLNITDQANKECNGPQYRKDLLSIVIIKNMHGHLFVNGANVMAKGNLLCFLTHFQPIVFTILPKQRPIIIQFNADLFCIQKHDAEIGCNGILFNNMYEPPVIRVTDTELEIFTSIVQQMIEELQTGRTGNVDMLESYIKQFLVHAVRIKKAEGTNKIKADSTSSDNIRMQEFRELIEEHYREERKLKFYAAHLHLSESGLHKLVTRCTGRTFTELISDKLMLDAKSQLFISNDPVKQISYDLGFTDPAYFTRFFKKQCGVTPEQYRQTIRNCPATV